MFPPIEITWLIVNVHLNMQFTKISDDEFDIDGQRFSLAQLRELKQNTENHLTRLRSDVESLDSFIANAEVSLNEYNSFFTQEGL